MDEGTQMGPVVNQKQRERGLGDLEKGVAEEGYLSGYKLTIHVEEFVVEFPVFEASLER